MFKWFRSSKFELSENEKEFARFIEKSKEYNKEMHNECVQILWGN